MKATEVMLKTRCGKVRVRVYADAGLPEDVVFVPMGPTANALVGSDTEEAGCLIQGPAGGGR